MTLTILHRLTRHGVVLLLVGWFVCVCESVNCSHLSVSPAQITGASAVLEAAHPVTSWLPHVLQKCLLPHSSTFYWKRDPLSGSFPHSCDYRQQRSVLRPFQCLVQVGSWVCFSIWISTLGGSPTALEQAIGCSCAAVHSDT